MVSMNFETIEFSIAESIATIRLNRPDRLNSFTQQMHEEIRAAFSLIQSDSTIRCTVLTGNGKGFCAGQDLNDRKFDPDSSPDLSVSLKENYNPLVRHITSLPMPVICAVNGVAAGAGVGIALSCDIVLAAESARFVLSFAKVGLGMDSGSSWNLPRLIGLQRARALALTGESITADKAEQWGLIWKCIADEKLEKEAMELAVFFSSQPTRGLAIIKQELLAAGANTLDEQLALEAEQQYIAGRTDDYREGVLSFLEKRKPDFKGS
jgi:2-(1,2-epoxy-1,2-dihydrophenyl)acetyl-CoA isomerase